MEAKIFGCKVNKYYTQKWLQTLKQKGKEQDFVIVASCEVTDRAKKKYIKEVKNLVKSGKIVLLTGCGVFEKGKKINREKFFERYSDLKEIQENIILLGENVDDFDEQLLNFFEIKNEKQKSLPEIENGKIMIRQPVIIQNGCDNYCSFCLSVVKRGKSRNRDLQEIICEINEFYKMGVKEIVITGINLAAWGCDDTKNFQKTKFPFLLKKILSETNISRIRISSLGPEYLNDDFFSVIQNPRILPHFHLSIQSFSDNVLSYMKRNYNFETLKNVLNNFNSLKSAIPILSLGADIIVGFPFEEEKDFEFTKENLQKYQVSKIHVFPFSAHKKGQTVPASNLQQIPRELRKKRAGDLDKFGKKLREDFIKKMIGKKFKVLWEEKKDGKIGGRTENYIYVSKDLFEDKKVRQVGEIEEILL